MGVGTAAGVLWHFFVQILRLAVAALTLTARQPDYQVTDPSAIKDIHVRIEDGAGWGRMLLGVSQPNERMRPSPGGLSEEFVVDVVGVWLK